MKNKNELIMVLSEGFGKSAILTRKEVIEYLDSKDMLGEVASAGAMTRFLGQNMEKVGYDSKIKRQGVDVLVEKMLKKP